MAHVTIHHDTIKRMRREIEESFNGDGPVRLLVGADAADGLAPTVAAPPAIYNFRSGSAHRGNSSRSLGIASNEEALAEG